ncbi:MAG TPA: metallophosphoesterase [Thermoanaerobaculia bacterium]|nr:metallophosphoesterase [Thermoanaerobaculia bacterium]
MNDERPIARLVVLSDLHLGPPGALAGFRAGEELVALVSGLEPAGTLLLWNGDLFDTLQVPGRPEVLDLEGAPRLLRQLCRDLAETPWGTRFFAALGAFVAGGGRSVVIPGNHDPELYHPEADAVLRAACGLSPEDPRLSIHRQAEPFSVQVSSREVLAGHGHLGDSWNRIEPGAIHRALERGARSLPLPPGSLLVLATVNVFKRACDPFTGRPRFPFVEQLHPSGPWVPLLLLALDPLLALPHLPAFLVRFDEVVVAELRHRLTRGPSLGTRGEAAPSEAEELSRAIEAALDEGDRQAPAAMARALELHFAGAQAATRGSLGVPGAGARLLLKAARRLFHDGGDFFSPEALSGFDRSLVDTQLPASAAGRVVLAGHTHAAREARLDGDRVYLNTGTWLDLLRLPAATEEPDLLAWAERLRAGAIEPLARRTYAEVDGQGARLATWPTVSVAPGGPQ